MEPLQPIDHLYPFTWSPTPNNMSTPLGHNTLEFEGLQPFSDAAPSRSEHIATGDASSQAADPMIVDSHREEDTVSQSRRPPAFEPAKRHSKRTKYTDLDWDGKREILRTLYLEQGKSLPETMQIMKNEHGFDASSKLYKDKFKVWKWSKNLPAAIAQWMVDRANARESDGKRTVFIYGGQEWTLEQAFRSANRIKKTTQSLVHTPAGMDVTTPGDALEHEGSGYQYQDADAAQDVIVIQSEPVNRRDDILLLSWNGKTREDLAVISAAAQSYKQQGDALQAERHFLEAYEGLKCLLSPTHDETVQVAYQLAEIYTQQNRRTQVDELFEKLAQDHINRWGIDDRKTQQFVLNIVELLNGWGREQDALAFAAHAWEVMESSQHQKTRQQAVSREETVHQSVSVSGMAKLAELGQAMDTTVDTRDIEHGLNIARVQVAVNELAVETFIKSVEQTCHRIPGTFALQGIRARSELLQLYIKQNDPELVRKHHQSFITAEDLLVSFWSHVSWNRKSPKSLELIEVSLELASRVLKGGFDNDAERIFERIEDKVTTVFHDDDERTIWTFISIGIIYQNTKSWHEARSWFERAFAAADARYDEDDGIYQSLESALENEHFSYITEQGRPFSSAELH